MKLTRRELLIGSAAVAIAPVAFEEIAFTPVRIPGFAFIKDNPLEAFISLDKARDGATRLVGLNCIGNAGFSFREHKTKALFHEADRALTSLLRDLGHVMKRRNQFSHLTKEESNVMVGLFSSATPAQQDAALDWMWDQMGTDWGYHRLV